ncbi:MAG: winged helix-turn-helix domain-containing protein [Spongiibacteraceae bacterium]
MRQPLIWIIDRDPTQRTQLQRDLHHSNSHQSSLRQSNSLPSDSLQVNSYQSEFDTRTFAHSRDIERRLMRERPDLLLMERMLDHEDGLELCRRLRQSGDDIPIIIVTSMNEAIDRITGFEYGADDYIGKPYIAGELIARIRAQLRRRRRTPIGAPLADGEDIVFGDCRLKLASRLLVRSGCNIELTSSEFAVLSALANNAHRSLTRERLLELARHPDNDASARSIDVQISRLRRLVEIDPTKPQHIQTVRGYGYVFVPEI